MATSSVTAKAGAPDLDLSGVRLPRSSTRLSLPRAFCRVVTAVHKRNGHVWVDGPLCASGAEIAADQCNLVLECAGPQGKGSGHRRAEVLWIVWQWGSGAWRERGRTLAIGGEWILTLGPLIERLLSEPKSIHDTRIRGREVADQVAALVDEHIGREAADVRREAWLSLYDQIPGRIVE